MITNRAEMFTVIVTSQVATCAIQCLVINSAQETFFLSSWEGEKDNDLWRFSDGFSLTETFLLVTIQEMRGGQLAHTYLLRTYWGQVVCKILRVRNEVTILWTFMSPVCALSPLTHSSGELIEQVSTVSWSPGHYFLPQ